MENRYALKLELDGATMTDAEAVLLQKAWVERQEVSITVKGKIITGTTYAKPNILEYNLDFSVSHVCISEE